MVNNNIIQSNTLGSGALQSTPQSAGSASSHSVSGSALQYSGSTPYGLEKGQIIKGEVTDLKNNEVSVKLDDGQVIKGRLAAEGNNLSIGSKVIFKVEDVTSQNLTLKILPADSSVYLEATIDKALEAANLSKIDRNRNMVAELLAARMSIDKNTLTALSKQMTQFPDSSIKTLVFLNRNNLPVNSTNVSFMESFQNSGGKVISELSALSDSVAQALSGESNTTSKYKLLSVLIPAAIDTGEGGKLPAALTTGGSNGSPLLSEVLTPAERSALADSMKSPNFFAATTQDMQGILSGGATLSETISLLSGGNALLTGSKSLTDRQSMGQGEQIALSPEVIQGKLTNLNPDILQKLLTYSATASKGGENTPDSVSNLLSTEERLQFLNRLTENFPPNGVPEAIKAGLSEGNITSTELLSKLKPFLADSSALTEDNGEKIINSKEFNRLLSSSLLSQWSISPEDLGKPSSISAHYDSLLKQLNDIKELTENGAFKESPALQSQTAQVTDTLNFMNNLNHLFTYLQLPVKLKSQYADSELYVYSNKKSELDIMEGVKVVLHLKMDSLGPVDVAVELKQNQLKNSFYLDYKDVRELLASHMETLETHLEEKGFHVKTEYYSREKEDISPAREAKDHFLSASNSPSPFTSEKKRYHFDIRA